MNDTPRQALYSKRAFLTENHLLVYIHEYVYIFFDLKLEETHCASNRQTQFRRQSSDYFWTFQVMLWLQALALFGYFSAFLRRRQSCL